MVERTEKESVMTNLFPVLYGWCLLSACFFSANALEQDFFPLAVGNWWEFTTKTGKTERWEITGSDSDAFTLIRIHKDTDYTITQILKPSDDKGRINSPPADATLVVSGRRRQCFPKRRQLRRPDNRVVPA